MKLRYTRPALADIDRLLAYVAAHSPPGSRRVNNRIQSLIGLILRHPRVGQLTSRPGMRRIAAAPFPYVMFYRATDDEVVIHGVRHSARSPSSMPGRPRR